MSPTDVSTRAVRAGSRAPLVALLLVAAIVTLALLRVASVAMASPEFVDQVTIVNGTPYGVDVDVRASDDADRLLLGRALPEITTARREVLDAGDRWVFTFVRGGTEGGRVEISRAELEAADWQVTVPDSVTSVFGQAGQQPYPEEGNR